MLESPCALTSWFASSNCPERTASERAMDRLVTSPSMPTATAPGSRRRISSRSNGNSVSGGRRPAKALTNATCANIAGHNQTTRLLMTKVINRLGQRGSRRLSTTPRTRVPKPSSSDGLSTAPMWSTSISSPLNAVASFGRSRPSRFGNCPRAITTAAPRVKPSTTECETKFTSAPKRSSPSNH